MLCQNTRHTAYCDSRSPFPQKYGTNDNQEIWLLKYGVMFEDMTILKPHITSINQNELIVNQTFYQLPEDKRRAVERFVN